MSFLHWVAMMQCCLENFAPWQLLLPLSAVHTSTAKASYHIVVAGTERGDDGGLNDNVFLSCGANSDESSLCFAGNGLEVLLSCPAGALSCLLVRCCCRSMPGTLHLSRFFIPVNPLFSTFLLHKKANKVLAVKMRQNTQTVFLYRCTAVHTI